MALTDLSIAADDKRIILSFSDSQLVLRFYDSPNAVLYQEAEVKSSFKKEPIKKAAREIVITDPLKQALPMLGKHLEKEFYIGYKEASVENISAFDALLRQSKEPILYEDNTNLLLSPIPLTGRQEGRTIGPSEGIEFVLRNRRRLQAIGERKQQLRGRLLLLAGRTAKAIEDTLHGLSEHSREDRYRTIAETIQFQASELPKGSTALNIELGGKMETLALDPKYSAYENAAYYFNKAKHAAEARAERTKQLESLQKNKASIEVLLAELDALTTIREIDGFERSLKAQSFLLERADENAERSGDDLDRYRRFVVTGGFEVLAGKNARQNDELTMRVAAKDDLWFHARHVAGSHVVLRRAGRKDIPKEAIMQAAQIAAFYSDAKTQKVAPVAYTARKFVRKRKGAPAGEVVIEREEVIMVEPKA